MSSSRLPLAFRLLTLLSIVVLAGVAGAQTTISAPRALNHNAIPDIGSNDDVFADIATDRKGTWIAVWHAPANDTTIDCSGSSDGKCGPDYEVLFAVSTNAGSTWSNAHFLNTDAESDSYSDVKPLIATDRKGNWVVVWSRTYEAAVSVSTNDGQTWSAPQVLSNVELSFNLVTDTMDFATNRKGVWILVWSSNDQGTGGDFDIFVSRSLDAGSTWSSPAAVNPSDDPAYDDEEPTIATDGYGKWVIVWQSDNQDGGKGADMDILASTSTNEGQGWSTPVAVNNDASTDGPLNAHDLRPDIATDSRGYWVTVWEEFSDSASPTGLDPDILWSRSTDNGGSWSAAAAVDPNANADTRDYEAHPAIVTDGHGGWAAAWEAAPPFTDIDLLIATSASDGTAWGNLQVLNTQALSDDGDDALVEMAADDSGNWVAVWNSTATLGSTVYADPDIFVTDFHSSLFYPINDLPLNALELFPGATTGTFTNAGTDGSSSCGAGGEGDVWYHFELPGGGVLEVDTCDSNVDYGVDTVVSIHTDEPGTVGNELACNDDWDSGSPTSCSASLDSSLTASIGSAPVWVRVARYPGTAVGDFNLYTVVPEPGALLLLASGALGLVGLERLRGRRRR